MSTEDDIPQGRIRRVVPIAAVTARTAGEGVVAALRKRATGREDPELTVRAAERYAQALGRSKGALMKAGQIMSFASMGPTVPPEFRTAYQAALARLRADAPPMAPELALSVVEAELGPHAFAEFDATPLAAASIGQVHAARTHDGRRVAVKVQYPGVGDAIRADLRNSELLSTFLGVAFGMSPRRVRMDTRGIAAELKARILEELDYHHEAANQRWFADRYRGHPFVSIPEVVDELSTARVLTQDFVEGRDWEDALTAPQALRDRWGEAVYRFLFGAQYRFTTYHADPHPGNYSFHDDGTISVMDFGCVARPDRGLLEPMWALVVTGVWGDDPQATWHRAVESGFLSATSDVTPQEIHDYWRVPFEMYWAPQPFTLTPEYAQARIERLFSPAGPSGKAMRESELPGSFATLARLQIGLLSMLGELRATAHWDTLGREMLAGAPPVTEMGKAEAAFFPAVARV